MVVGAARAHAGEDAWQQVLDGLSPAARALAQAPPAPGEWIPADLAAECFRAFERAGHLGPVPGTVGAETFHHRHPAAFSSPEELLAALPGFFRQSVEGGEMTTEPTGPGEGVIRILASWDAPYFFEVHAPAWFRHGWALLGRPGLQVTYHPPSGESFIHEYRLVWS
jgi:hypothetical protein